MAIEPVLIDSNVILDVVAGDPAWEAWSRAALVSVGNQAYAVINPIIYSEVSVRFDKIEHVEAAVPAEFYRRESLPWEAAFLAGKKFEEYRRRGGARRSPLPDFFIGAHALVRGYRVLTRDPGRYKAYFPTVALIAP